MVVRFAGIVGPVLLFTACGPERNGSTPVPVEEPPASPVAEAPEQGPSDPEDPTVPDACRTFAGELAERVSDGRRVAAVLPLTDGTGRATACSELLAGQVMVALRDASFEVADRQLLQAVLEEHDLASVFERGPGPGQIAGADLLVAGRFALAAGRVSLQLKAIEVATNQLVHYGFYTAVPDESLLAVVVAPPRPTGGGESPQVTRTEAGVRIRASYAEAGADEFRLLDRVRQDIRRTLRWYLADVIGRGPAETNADDLFRRGRETDCVFGRGTVTLEMEFEVHP
jgi:hypothetical protein